MKMNVMILLIVLIAVVIGFGIFLLVRNTSQGTGSNNPEINTSQVTVKDPQLNSLLNGFDASEPNDATATTGTDTVDSTGLI